MDVFITIFVIIWILGAVIGTIVCLITWALEDTITYALEDPTEARALISTMGKVWTWPIYWIILIVRIAQTAGRK